MLIRSEKLAGQNPAHEFIGHNEILFRPAATRGFGGHATRPTPSRYTRLVRASSTGVHFTSCLVATCLISRARPYSRSYEPATLPEGRARRTGSQSLRFAARRRHTACEPRALSILDRLLQSIAGRCPTRRSPVPRWTASQASRPRFRTPAGDPASYKSDARPEHTRTPSGEALLPLLRGRSASIGGPVGIGKSSQRLRRFSRSASCTDKYWQRTI